jgi:transposase
MRTYVGLDVPLNETAIRVVDDAGKVLAEKKLPSAQDAIAAFIADRAPEVARVGLETGSLSVWLHGELRPRGLPIICIDARDAKAALSTRINKTDRNDAAGLAQIMRTGWYHETHVKSGPSHLARALLASCALLVGMHPSALQAWGLGIAKRSGFKKVKVAVARKLSIILHRIWHDGTEFRPTGTAAAAA